MSSEICLRCGHKWLPKYYKKEPKVCPNCKSPKWDTLKQFNERGAKRLKTPGDKFGYFKKSLLLSKS